MVEKKKSQNINFLTNWIYFAVVVCFIIVRVCANSGLFKFMGEYASYILGLITQIGLIFLLPLFLFKSFAKTSVKNTLKFCNYKKVSAKTVVVSIVLGMVVFLLNIYVSNFFNSIIQFLGYKPSTSSSGLPATWWTLLLDLLCTAILPAICEETLHRGMLLNGHSNLGIKKSILISGFLFGLLHCNIEQFFYASIIGIFLGYLCWCTSSIYPCMIVHFMNNAISVFLSFARDKGWAIGNVFTYISEFLTKNALLGFVMFFLVLCLLVLLVFELTKFLVKDSFNYNFAKRQKELASMAIRDNYFKQIEAIKNNNPQKENIYAQKENVIVVDASEFLQFVDKNMGDIIKKADELEKQEPKPKLDSKTKIFLVGSFVLTAIVTIMTFIWGLL